MLGGEAVFPALPMDDSQLEEVGLVQPVEEEEEEDKKSASQLARARFT